MILTIVLILILWISMGLLAIYMVGLAERFSSFRSEDEEVLLIFGPLAPFLVIFAVSIILFIELILKIRFINPCFIKKIKRLGKGA